MAVECEFGVLENGIRVCDLGLNNRSQCKFEAELTCVRLSAQADEYAIDPSPQREAETFPLISIISSRLRTK